MSHTHNADYPLKSFPKYHSSRRSSRRVVPPTVPHGWLQVVDGAIAPGDITDFCAAAYRIGGHASVYRTLRAWPRIVIPGDDGFNQALGPDRGHHIVGDVPDGWRVLLPKTKTQAFDILCYAGGARVMLPPGIENYRTVRWFLTSMVYPGLCYGRVTAVCRHPFVYADGNTVLPYVREALIAGDNWFRVFRNMFNSRRAITFRSTNAIPLPLP